jgi:Ca2+-binding RTX toxin-like protein
VLTGGAGKDKIGARGGNDIIRVRDGFADRVTCGSGLDVVIADVRGIDRVGLNCEVVRRGRADRTLVGTGEDDILVGTPGPDVIVGLGGDDILLGFGGADRLRGGNGDDTATGGSGRDILNGGAGSDKLVGGRGNDRVRARDGTEDRVDGGAGHDAASIDRFLDVVRRVEAFF